MEDAGCGVYFDNSGGLVAARAGTDYGAAFCDGKADFQTYGPIPDCSYGITEKLCP